MASLFEQDGKCEKIQICHPHQTNQLWAERGQTQALYDYIHHTCLSCICAPSSCCFWALEPSKTLCQTFMILMGTPGFCSHCSMESSKQALLPEWSWFLEGKHSAGDLSCIYVPSLMTPFTCQLMNQNHGNKSLRAWPFQAINLTF